MKFLILLLCFFPVSIFAQDTVALNYQANLMARSLIKEDYNTLVYYMPASSVKLSGGRQKIIAFLKKDMASMRARGFYVQKADIGKAGKFYKSGKFIHCIMPETIYMKAPGGVIKSYGHLLAATDNNGKHWSFLDFSKMSYTALKQLFPDINPEIPEQVPPTFIESDE
jgi:hypothetical protein